MVVSTPAIIAPIGRGDTVSIGYCTIRRGWLYLDLGRAHESSKKEAQLSRVDAHYYPARYVFISCKAPAARGCRRARARDARSRIARGGAAGASSRAWQHIHVEAPAYAMIVA